VTGEWGQRHAWGGSSPQGTEAGFGIELSGAVDPGQRRGWGRELAGDRVRTLRWGSISSGGLYCGGFFFFTETLFHLAVAIRVIVLKSMGSFGSLTNDRGRNPFTFIISYRYIPFFFLPIAFPFLMIFS
jgi:hypothetical protein